MKILMGLAVASLLTGCSTGSLTGDMLLYGPLNGPGVYGQGQNRAGREAGDAPPRELGRRCVQDATIREASGTWTYHPELTEACFEAAGWHRVKANAWTGQDTWERVRP
jgi:hypothetical protein